MLNKIVAYFIKRHLLTNLIKNAVRYGGDKGLLPREPSCYHVIDIDFKRDYERFTAQSRTCNILSMLEQKSSLEVKKNAADLLPSTNLLIGYKVEGDAWQVKNEDNLLYAGISLDWPFPHQVQSAEHEIARIEHKKTKLSNRNKYLELEVNLKNIFLSIERETELIRIIEEKIKLSEDVLKDEAENYSYGKVTLNDYIDAVNRLDRNKFSKITHLVQLKKLTVEWLRLTDSLVGENSLEYKD
ncbi:MAG: TolC family protein [Candidatus Omnitrophica bacterium]|nr:TolC family protein [Candidatus Omnitrophota bacterium]MBU4478580.1 TolC family protein [Candidatus Omnitrophota bacterium]